jgi:hypothetical protein
MWRPAPFAMTRIEMPAAPAISLILAIVSCLRFCSLTPLLLFRPGNYLYQFHICQCQYRLLRHSSSPPTISIPRHMNGVHQLQTLFAIRTFLNESCPLLCDRLEETVQIPSHNPHLILAESHGNGVIRRKPDAREVAIRKALDGSVNSRRSSIRDGRLRERPS